jgi:hypothetical protein
MPPLYFTYRNWRGEVAVRRALPLRFTYEATQWHPERQWLLIAHDLDKDQERAFAVKDILAFGPDKPEQGASA